MKVGPPEQVTNPDGTLAYVYAGLCGKSWMHPDEVDALALALPPEALVLEVGTASGVTAAVVAGRRADVRIVCVDLFVGVDWAVTRIDDAGRTDNWRRNSLAVPGRMWLWLGDLASFCAMAPARRFDAVIVDGDHLFDGVWSDLRLAETVVRPDGLILAHDCQADGLWPDVHRAVERFCRERGWRVEVPAGTLAVLRKG
jgi:predicted O-methyltransferase YrrM